MLLVVSISSTYSCKAFYFKKDTIIFYIRHFIYSIENYVQILRSIFLS